MFYIVTRAGGWVLLALAIVAGGVAIATHVPAITQSPKVTLRLQMWLDPWYNAIPFGDQTARARWAIAAGGFGGRGLGAAPATALPAGHTDLVQAHLTEEMGAAGMIVYLVLLAAIAGQGLWIAAWNRTPERMLLAAGPLHIPDLAMVRHLRGDDRALAPDRRGRALPVLGQDGNDRLHAHGGHDRPAGRERRTRARRRPSSTRCARGTMGDPGRQSCSSWPGAWS